MRRRSAEPPGRPARAGWASIALLAALSSGAFAVGAAAREAPPALAHAPADLATTHFRAVVVAADAAIPVFDNAATRVAQGLAASGGAVPGAVRRLSAAPVPAGAETATRAKVLAAIEALRPGPGEGCLVFATGHGERNRGLALPRSGRFLGPAALDAALLRGCGRAPTVVILSACYSGAFAKGQMARANRIVLTAARADRPSFGCSAGRTYTFFDGCLLAALDRVAGRGWRAVAAEAAGCVGRLEARLRSVPSKPQAHFGPAVAEALAVPWRPTEPPAAAGE